MNQLLFRRALVAVRDCIQIGQGQDVLVVEDGTLSHRIAEAFVYSAKAVGANAMMMNFELRHFISLREYGLFGGASLGRHEFVMPRPVLKAMETSDVSIILNSDMQIMFDEGFLALRKPERKLVWVPYIDEDSFVRLFPESAAEAFALHETTTRVGNIFAGAHELAIRSSAGTDVRMRIGDYRINWGTGVFEVGKGYGGVEILPGGQISSMPNARTAQGRVVIDRSVDAPQFKELLDPIEFTVENGYVTRIEGGVEAERMKRFLAALDDDGEAYHVTEVGVGTNRRCHMAGIAGPCEDTHTWGCVSLALGADVHLGGETLGACHLDMTMRSATLTLDDSCVIVEEGQLVV